MEPFTFRPHLHSHNSDDWTGQSIQYQQIGTASPTIIGTYSNQLKSLYNWDMRGIEIVNFHARRKRGELMPMTPYRRILFNGGSDGVTVHRYATISGKLYHQYYNETAVVGSPYPWIVTEAEVLASFDADAALAYVQEAAAKIYSNGHDTFTFLAELADVRRLFAGTLKALLKAQIPRNVKSLSCRWLAYRYGWRTLLYDLADLNKAIRSLSEAHERTRYSEHVGRDTTTTNVTEWTTGQSSYCYTRTYWNTDTVKVGLRGSIAADISVPQFQFNPLITGWELIPFSFVLDWLISVGTSLATMSFLMLQHDYVAAQGIRVDFKREFHNEVTSWKSPWSGTDYGDGHCDVTFMWRIPSHIPILPQLRLRLNKWKILDLLALVVQRFH